MSEVAGSWPQIPPVTAGPRPFWSVMIPTFNPGKYLEEALVSVLEQDPGSTTMEIQVVDDHSTRTDAEAIVRDVAGDRATFFRQPANVGHAANFNTCLRRARGEVVHVLHDDDRVLAGFYAALEPAFHDHPEVGAAFTRFLYARSDGHWHSLSPLEAPTAGVLDDFLHKIASGQRLATPCIAVRRSIYEDIGGFDPRFTVGGEDWEMWVRVASNTQIWFEPQPLAVYRMWRPGSLTGNAQGTAALAQDMLMASDIVETYLPASLGPDPAQAALKRARSLYSKWAVEAASDLLGAGRAKGAVKALAVARSGVAVPHLVARVMQVVGRLTSHRLKTWMRGR